MQLRSPYDRDIAALAIPALGTLVAEPLYVLADTAFVGHLGTSELAGLALATTILLTLHSVLIFLAYGTTGPVARLLSAGQTTDAAHRSWQAILLGGLLGTVSIAAIAVTGNSILGLLSDDPNVLQAAKTYLYISLAGFPFLIVTMAANGCFHGRQNTRTPLLLAVAGALANLAIEFVLIILLGYGVGASALSTVLVQVAVGLVAVWLVGSWSKAQGAPWGPDFGAMRHLLRSGKALLVRGICLRGSFSLATVVAASIGVVELAAHQVATGIWITLTLALDAVAIAGQALTGRWLGIGDVVKAKAATRRMIEIDFAVGAVMGAIVLLLRGPLSNLFTGDVGVAKVVAFLLIYLALQQPLNGVVFALDGILIGAGDFDYLARSMVFAAGTFAAMAWAVVATGGGVGWLWLAIGAFMLVRLITLRHRWHRDQWLVVGAD